MKNRVKKQALSFAAAMAMILGGGMQLYAADKIADTVYHNGKIYTIAETAQEAKDIANAKKADVVATLNGKIVFVGSEADAKAQGYLDAAKVNNRRSARQDHVARLRGRARPFSRREPNRLVQR